jgi:hypothetical protein
LQKQLNALITPFSFKDGSHSLDCVIIKRQRFMFSVLSKTIGLISVFVLLLFHTSQAQQNQQFAPGCPLPFADIAVERDIDDECGIKGEGTKKNTAANELQNMAKNNFCATGTVRDVTVKSLVSLNRKVKDAGITYGTYLNVPADRDGLQSLGEGTRARFIGYINHVKYANESTGEGVNCKALRAENNDIHMELTIKKNETNKCKRISAEISPHFRPDAWNVPKLREVQELGMKIRITGQLFFDASHTSCADASNGGGYRASSWEIHPVYRIEVYLDGEWVDLHDISFPSEDE